MLLRSLFILCIMLNLNLSACAASAATDKDFTVSKGELGAALVTALSDQLYVKCIDIGTTVSIALSGMAYDVVVTLTPKKMVAGDTSLLPTPVRAPAEQESYLTLQQILYALPDPVTASWGGKISASKLTDWFIQAHVLSDGTLVLSEQMYKPGDQASWLSIALTPKE